MHWAQKHEIKPDAQKFAAGGFCVACGRDQHTRARLLYHLRYSSRRCLDNLTQIMEPFDETEVAELKRQQAEQDARLRDEGYKPEKALRPVDRHAGPKMYRPGGGRDRGGPAPAWVTLEAADHQRKFEPAFNVFKVHLILHLFSG